MSTGFPRSLFIGVGYFAIAGLTIAFTRFGGGFANLWFATAFLSAALATTPRNSWAATILWCGIGSAAATGIFGLGWAASAPLAVINLIEAAAAALLMKRRVSAGTLDSLAWFGRFTLKVGFIAPALGASLGTLALVALRQAPAAEAWVTWYVGHALGSLTFTPIALLLFKGEAVKWSERSDLSGWREAAVLYLLFLATTLFTFAQSRWPILFLPLGPLTLICFRHDRALPALAIATLGIVGGLFTAAQHGPIALAAVERAGQVQFFQFYLASVVLTILPVTADLHSRRRLVASLRDNEARFRVLLDNTSDIVLHLHSDGTILFASPSVEAISGKPVEALRGTNAIDLVEDDWRTYVRAHHQEVLAARGETVRYEYMAPTSDGCSRWFETMSRAVVGHDGKVESVISVVRDIDQRKQEEYDLVLEVSRDPLTGLSNRRAFTRTFDTLKDSEILSVAMVDIDHFKSINDRYGHAAGDCALQTFAEVARRAVRKDDLVARLGGEEFAILFRGIRSDQASQICERLRLEIADAITFYGATPIRYTVSIGVTDVTSPDIDHALNKADAALYDAKREGRDRLKLAA